MKSLGIVVVLLGLLGLTWLLMRDVQSVTGERDGKVVVEPLQRAKDAADAASRSQKQLQEGVDAIDR